MVLFVSESGRFEEFSRLIMFIIWGVVFLVGVMVMGFEWGDGGVVCFEGVECIFFLLMGKIFELKLV